jgi:hypothetical protein
MERYFVVVLGRDADAMRALQKFGFDLFAQTAKQSGQDKDYPFAIDGLLSPAEIDTLKQAGYRVRTGPAAEKRARGAENPLEFSQWLKGVQVAVTRERAAAARTSAAAARAAKRAAPEKAASKKPASKVPARKKAAARKPKRKAAKRK